MVVAFPRAPDAFSTATPVVSMNAPFAPALSFEAVPSALAPFVLAPLSAVATAILAVAADWVREFAADPGHAFPGQGQMKPEQAEIERLRREVQKLKAERDILKKAAAYFAKDQI